jgi:hypothetical protein
MLLCVTSKSLKPFRIANGCVLWIGGREDGQEACLASLHLRLHRDAGIRRSDMWVTNNQRCLNERTKLTRTGSFPLIFPIKTVWLSSAFLLVGGGQKIYNSMVFALVSDALGQEDRYTISLITS